MCSFVLSNYDYTCVCPCGYQFRIRSFSIDKVYVLSLDYFLVLSVLCEYASTTILKHYFVNTNIYTLEQEAENKNPDCVASVCVISCLFTLFRRMGRVNLRIF